MGRGKVQLKLIEDQRQRKKTYRTRKEGLKKKIYELSTLCDIDAALVCFDPTGGGGGGGGQVDMWPNDKQRVKDIFSRYYSSRGSLTTAADHEGCDEQQQQQQQPVDQEASLESRLNSVRERIQYLLMNMQKENKYCKETEQDLGGGSSSSTWSCYNNLISIPDHAADAGLGGGLLDFDQYHPYHHHHQQQQQLTVFDPVPLAASFDWAMDGTVFDCSVTATDHAATTAAAAAAAAATDCAQLLPLPPVVLDAGPLAVAPPLMMPYHMTTIHGGHGVADAGAGHDGPSMDGINIGIAQYSSDQQPAADWYWSI